MISIVKLINVANVRDANRYITELMCGFRVVLVQNLVENVDEQVIKRAVLEAIRTAYSSQSGGEERDNDQI